MICRETCQQSSVATVFGTGVSQSCPVSAAQRCRRGSRCSATSERAPQNHGSQFPTGLSLAQPHLATTKALCSLLPLSQLETTLQANRTDISNPWPTPVLPTGPGPAGLRPPTSQALCIPSSGTRLHRPPQPCPIAPGGHSPPRGKEPELPAILHRTGPPAPWRGSSSHGLSQPGGRSSGQHTLSLSLQPPHRAQCYSVPGTGHTAQPVAQGSTATARLSPARRLATRPLSLASWAGGTAGQHVRCGTLGLHWYCWDTTVWSLSPSLCAHCCSWAGHRHTGSPRCQLAQLKTKLILSWWLLSRAACNCSCSSKAQLAMNNDTRAGMRGWSATSVTQPYQTARGAAQHQELPTQPLLPRKGVSEQSQGPAAMGTASPGGTRVLGVRTLPPQ